MTKSNKVPNQFTRTFYSVESNQKKKKLFNLESLRF